MKYVILLVCLGVLLAECSGAQPTPDGSKIDAIVQAAIAKHVAPSACVVIGTKDSVIFAKAYGQLTYDEGSPPATLDTIYDLASVSKAVGTTSATMLLFQDSKLHLEDPVYTYVPAFDQEDKRGITIRHLLAHSSGLPSYTQADKAEAGRREGESKSDALIRFIASLPLKYKTGEGHLYACLNFITLARVNEKVAGMPQEQFLRERLFVPLGMTNTGYMLTDEQKTQAAPTVGAPHFRQGTVRDPLAAYYIDSEHSGGNAGLFSSANDLTRFSQMILLDGQWNGKQILKPETIDRFVTNSLPLKLRETYGLGWGRYLRPPSATPLNRGYDKAAFGHNGYTGTYIHFDRLVGTFLVVLTNRVYPDDSTSDYSIRRGILWLMLESDPKYKGIVESLRARRQ